MLNDVRQISSHSVKRIRNVCDYNLTHLSQCFEAVSNPVPAEEWEELDRQTTACSTVVKKHLASRSVGVYQHFLFAETSRTFIFHKRSLSGTLWEVFFNISVNVWIVRKVLAHRGHLSEYSWSKFFIAYQIACIFPAYLYTLYPHIFLTRINVNIQTFESITLCTWTT